MPFQKEVNDDRLTHRIIGCAIEVHKALGSERAEHLYSQALSDELSAQDIDHETEYAYTFTFRGRSYDGRADIYIPEGVVLELKAVARTTSGHFQQLKNNVEHVDATRGLLLNFGPPTLDIRRYADNWSP